MSSRVSAHVPAHIRATSIVEPHAQAFYPWMPGCAMRRRSSAAPAHPGNTFQPIFAPAHSWSTCIGVLPVDARMRGAPLVVSRACFPADEPRHR